MRRRPPHYLRLGFYLSNRKHEKLPHLSTKENALEISLFGPTVKKEQLYCEEEKKRILVNVLGQFFQEVLEVKGFAGL